jgi:hypothetical protein
MKNEYSTKKKIVTYQNSVAIKTLETYHYDPLGSGVGAWGVATYHGIGHIICIKQPYLN